MMSERKQREGGPPGKMYHLDLLFALAHSFGRVQEWTWGLRQWKPQVGLMMTGR